MPGALEAAETIAFEEEAPRCSTRTTHCQRSRKSCEVKPAEWTGDGLAMYKPQRRSGEVNRRDRIAPNSA